MNPDTDARLTALEVKVTYLDDLVETLNAMVAKQHDQIAMLIHEVSQLKQRQDDSPAVGIRSLRDDLPPHY